MGYAPPPGMPAVPPWGQNQPPQPAPPPAQQQQPAYGQPPPAPQPWQQPPQPWQQPPQAQAAPGQAIVHRFHKGARFAYNFMAVLFILLVITIPIAIWAFITAARGRLEVLGNQIITHAFFTRRYDLSRARRLGVLEVPVYARGIGGAVAKAKVGGGPAIHICWIDDQGRKNNVLISMYERHPDVINHFATMLRLPLEKVEQGLLGPKWAEPKA